MDKTDKSFQITANIILCCVMIFCVAPFLLLISSSLSNDRAIILEGYSLWPRQLDLKAYKYILFDSNNIINAYQVSVIVMVLGTIINLTISLLFAYPISKRDLPGRNVFVFILFFTILFNGGLIPTYIMWTRTFNIKNTLAALVVPNLLMNGFFVIIARNYFSTIIPEAVFDSAKIDGANEGRTFVQIVLPLSKPIIATLALFVSLGYWNDWLNGLYYVNEEKLYTIQLLLNRMLMDTAFLQSGLANGFRLAAGETLPLATIKMAVAVLGALPLLVVYPFISRHLTSGIVIGSVKG